MRSVCYNSTLNPTFTSMVRVGGSSEYTSSRKENRVTARPGPFHVDIRPIGQLSDSWYWNWINFTTSSSNSTNFSRSRVLQVASYRFLSVFIASYLADSARLPRLSQTVASTEQLEPAERKPFFLDLFWIAHVVSHFMKTRWGYSNNLTAHNVRR